MVLKVCTWYGYKRNTVNSRYSGSWRINKHISGHGRKLPAVSLGMGRKPEFRSFATKEKWFRHLDITCLTWSGNLNRTIKHIGLLIGVLCSFLTLAKSGDTLLISQLNSEGYYDLRAHQEVYQTDTVLSPMAFLQNRGVLSQAKEGYSQQYWY